jgi:hypothetical protein
MLVVPEDIELINTAVEGMKYPIAIPIAIAEKIQTVKYLSRKPNRLFSRLGEIIFSDIF